MVRVLSAPVGGDFSLTVMDKRKFSLVLASIISIFLSVIHNKFILQKISFCDIVIKS